MNCSFILSSRTLAEFFPTMNEHNSLTLFFRCACKMFYVKHKNTNSPPKKFAKTPNKSKPNIIDMQQLPKLVAEHFSPPVTLENFFASLYISPLHFDYLPTNGENWVW